MSIFSILPEQASTVATKVDAIFYVLVALSIFFLFAVCGVLVYLSVRYRKGTKVDRDYESPDNAALEWTWTITPLFLAVGMFVWSAFLYFDMSRPPETAMEILVTGKQWMWKIQHPNGKREINELHVPINQTIQLTMRSEDVIHDFFIPAFRVKKDVLPDRYTQLWFEATKPGTYHLFCAEYCGTGHSHMVGRVVAMEQNDYEAWLGGEASTAAPAQAGERLFNRLGCVTCHRADDQARGPHLAGLFGTEVRLQNNTTVIADEDYVRRSITNPTADVVYGYAQLMPSYAGMLSPDELNQLVAYIKSLGPNETMDAAQ